MACVECKAEINESNKSCLKQYCLTCFTRNLNERLEAEGAQTKQEATLQTPERGWSRQKRESEQNWFARVQSVLDAGSKRQRQEYNEQWRHSMTDEEKHAFRTKILALQHPDLLPAEAAPLEDGQAPAAPAATVAAACEDGEKHDADEAECISIAQDGIKGH